MPSPTVEWKRPELVVLVRSRPEESVLAGCKQPSSSGAMARFAGCKSVGLNGKGEEICQGSCSGQGTS